MTVDLELQKVLSAKVFSFSIVFILVVAPYCSSSIQFSQSTLFEAFARPLVGAEGTKPSNNLCA
jgi:hypothetical protein